MEGVKNHASIRNIVLWNTAFPPTRRRETMTDHKIGTREEWLAERLEPAQGREGPDAARR